jgi:hypothetical protein
VQRTRSCKTQRCKLNVDNHTKETNGVSIDAAYRAAPFAMHCPTPRLASLHLLRNTLNHTRSSQVRTASFGHFVKMFTHVGE